MNKVRRFLDGENALIVLAILPSVVWLAQLALLRAFLRGGRKMVP